jgi:hypothetical protein
MMSIFLKRSLAAIPVALSLGGCSALNPTQVPATDYHTVGNDPQGSMFGDQGIFGSLFGVRHNNGAEQGGGGGLGVNAYLWRGALDTLSFMPLQSADPFGGVIITDWYSPPDSPNERFKATAYILGRELRADAIRITMFRQVFQDGHWVDASVSPVTVGDI